MPRLSSLFSGLALQFLFLVCASTAANAAIHYVRNGSAAPNDGTSWDTAYPDLPATLVRGDTYYVAAGTYRAYTFDDTGTGIITIKKATDADHGPGAGWKSNNSGYGNAPAIFGPLTFNADYYIIDGVTGAGSLDIRDRSYGIKIVTGSSHGVGTGNEGVSNITISHVEIAGVGDDGCPGWGSTNETVSLRNNNTNGKGDHRFWSWRYMYIHDAGAQPFYWARVSDSILENSYIARNESVDCAHGEGIYGFGSNNIIRNNIWEDIEGSGVIMISGSGWQVYNNVLFGTASATYSGVGNGAIADWSPDGDAGPSNNNQIYSNTFYNLKGNGSISFRSCGSTGCNTSSNNIARNNLFFASTNQSINNVDTVSNNLFATSDPFAESSAQNFRLKVGSAAINAGAALSGFATDLTGAPRPNGNGWDLGAYEYGINAPPNPPSNLRLE